MIRLALRLFIIAAALALGPAAFAAESGFGPIPAYPSNVTKSSRMGTGRGVIKTSDSVDQVVAWFRKNLPAGTTEGSAPNGRHTFHLANGAGIAVGPGNSFNPGTSIGMTWK